MCGTFLRTMTRILLISRCPPYPLHLGDRLIVYHLASELDWRGHTIDLLAFADRPEDYDEIHHYDMYFGSVELIPEPGRSQAAYLRRALLPGARWPRAAAESWSPPMWEAIRRQLATHTYDLVHLFGGIQVYEFFHALGDVPALITPYESYSLYLRRALDSALDVTSWATVYLQLQMARRFESWMFTRYRRVVVLAERDRRELLDIHPHLPVQVIPNGVDLYYFTFRRPFVRHHAPALLFVGNYEYAPNLDAALRLAKEILPAVQRQIPGIKLWLVGNNPPPELQALAGESVKVTGRVPDVRPYLARAAAFISPLRLGAGLKNKILEALAVGCPVIATPLSLDGIAVRDGQDVLIAHDDSQMIVAILRLLTDPALQTTLAHNGRCVVEQRYSWWRVAEQYEELYDSIRGL
ncbi:MAG: glycosyltransferase [Anaerolineaceae bacterium]|nr:glycosyltransferase [Anaerolineaceae bacterium]